MTASVDLAALVVGICATMTLSMMVHINWKDRKGRRCHWGFWREPIEPKADNH